MISAVSRTRGAFLVIASSLMFASYGLWAKFIGNNFGVFYQSWSRALIITLILLPILIYRKEIIPVRREDWGWLSIFLVFTSLTQVPLFYAFVHMDIGSATLLFFVTFLLTMYGAGALFLGEKLNAIKYISFLLALGGLYLVFSFSYAVFTLFAALMAMLNGIASGGEIAFSKKLSSRYSALYLSWLSWVALIITNAPLSLWLGETQHLPSFQSVWLYQVCFVIAAIIGFWAVIEGLKYIEASIGGLLGLLEVIFSIAFGIVIFGEKLSVKIVLGACLILLAAALPHLQALYIYKCRNRAAQANS
jgi:drug/metabolite transporter (DMT)-like permease